MCGFVWKCIISQILFQKMCKCEIDDRDVGGSRETARATAKPQIEFSRLGDNPHSYLKTYLSLKQKKISFVWNCFGSSRYFWDYIFGPGGARSLSFPLFHVSGNDVIVFFVFWNPIKGDQDNTYLTQWEKEGCYRSTGNLLWDWSREVIKLSTTHTF